MVPTDKFQSLTNIKFTTTLYNGETKHRVVINENAATAQAVDNHSAIWIGTPKSATSFIRKLLNTGYVKTAEVKHYMHG